MAKIAYIFFGQVKNFDERQHSAFQENVVSKLSDFDVDYFLVTSKSSFYCNPRYAESEPGVSNIDYTSIQKYVNFEEIYYDQDARAAEDIDGLCESVIKFGEAWKEGDALQSLKNSIKQIYSLEYFYGKFADKINEYDYFVLSRSDLYHTHPLNVDCFSRDGDLFAPYYDVCPQIDYGWFGGINDRFAVIKNKSALKTYCTRYSSIKNNPEYYHAEQYLLRQLKTNNVNYCKINNFMFLLNRASGKLSDFVGIQPDEKMNTNLKGISKSYFINLDRRADRLHHMLINTPFFTERFSAIDSKQMQLTDEVKKLFPKTWQKRTKAEICCAISHYRLWQKLIDDRGAKNYLILEDDTVFKPGFVNFWDDVYSEHLPEDAFLVYLGGCQPWNKPQYHKVLQRYNDYFYTVKRNDYFTKDNHFWHMNANSYVLSKQAANLLCQWVEQFGMDEALDNFMQNFFNENKLFAAPELVFHMNPLMSYQLHEENDNAEIDKKSDLRLAEERFGNDEGVSVIIPTIWKANDYMIRSLLDLDKVDCVKEVIVIDNDTSKTPHWISAFEKVKLIDSGKRMYFNESVNFGIDLCENDICCIYNDDITSDTRVFDYVRNNLTKKDGCIFISPKYINNKKQSSGGLIKVDDIVKNGLHRGSGMMMFLRKQGFIKIPKQLIHHFGDTFIFEINKKQRKQNYIVEGFPIETPGSASQDDSVTKVIADDWKVHKEVFCDLGAYLNEEISFPRLTSISKKQIPKKIHLSWKNKNVLDSNYQLIQKGARNLKLLNPDWDVQVSNDEDVNRYVCDNIGKSSWRLIKDKKITEKTDLWRLLKIYKEGGLYVDIDRYIDTPLSEIMKIETACVVPTFQDIDFSQDFVLSCADNPMIGRAISNNLFNRKDGRNLFYTAICSYMHAASEFLSGAKIERGDNPKYFNDIRNKINACKYIETYRELGPEHHTLFRNIDKQFNAQTFEKDKADFYNAENVVHWNAQTQAFHVSQKTKKQKIIFTHTNLFEQDFICELFDDFDVVINEDMNIVEEDSVIVYSDESSKKHVFEYSKENAEYLLKFHDKLYGFLDKLKNKNCILVHLSDEHCHAEIDHYKNFKHVFRQYYRKDAKADNVTFIPLGYKKGFKS
jgi:GR25 family glycosyltransferase involved in LPS biosynthesis